MPKNSYDRWLITDFDLCLPVLEKDRLYEILAKVAITVERIMGFGPTCVTCLDLEQLQIVNYGKFEGISKEQLECMARLHSQEPIWPEEMIYLALRSLFQYVWPKPTSNDDVRFVATHDAVLHKVLCDTALDLAKQFAAPDALLPYWGRLAFLRIMVDIPTENISRWGLDHVACTLVKKAKLNARTFTLDIDSLIGINYVLEPILKQLNRYLIHYFSTEEMAGPNRLIRAWNSIASTVRYFWSEVAATELMRFPTILFDEQMALMAHHLTADQVSFIVMHELGHVALNHPRQIQAKVAKNGDIKTLRHEFEFAADGFALGLIRSKLLQSLRPQSTSPSATEAETNSLEHTTASFHKYQEMLCAIYLLFVYMDFIQRAGELLRNRLGGRINISSRMDTHPEARARLERLERMNLGEFLYTSPIQRYAQDFLQSVLDYATTLDDESLYDSLNIPL
jgi:hypothetical protein